MKEMVAGGTDDLWRQFVVDEDLLAARMDVLLMRLVVWCRIDARGHVQFVREGLAAKQKIAVVAAARAVASRRMPDVADDVSVAEIATCTGLPKNQVSARCAELVNRDRLFETSTRGSFRIVQSRIERFLDGLPSAL